jgi:hypothetical protein
MLADGGDCLSGLRAVRDQEPLFGAVASNATASRVIDRLARDPVLLDALRRARAVARERAWDAGGCPGRIVIDIDATLITAHSDKDSAVRKRDHAAIWAKAIGRWRRPTWRRTLGMSRGCRNIGAVWLV